MAAPWYGATQESHPAERWWEVGEAATLEGVAAGSSTVVGELDYTPASGISVEGSSSGQASVSGDLSPTRGIFGGAAGTSAVAGELTLLAVGADGASSGQASVSGSLTMALGVTGASAGTSFVSGVLGIAALNDGGTSTGQATVEGSLAIIILTSVSGVSAGSSQVGNIYGQPGGPHTWLDIARYPITEPDPPDGVDSEQPIPGRDDNGRRSLFTPHSVGRATGQYVRSSLVGS